MHRDDVLKNLTMWVLGNCTNHNLHFKNFNLSDPAQQELFNDWACRVTETMWKCLKEGTQVLDGSCSDFECVLGLEARKVFLVHMQHSG